MGKLFNSLVSEGLFYEWGEILDWLFDEERFSSERGWTSGYVGLFIKKVKRLPMIGKKTYFYDSAKYLKFPTKSRNLKIMHSKGSSEARDLIRHIRNGIAHGRTKMIRKDGELYIEIKDFSSYGKQSSYMYMPLNYINEFYRIYVETEKAKNNNKKINKL